MKRISHKYAFIRNYQGFRKQLLHFLGGGLGLNSLKGAFEDTFKTGKEALDGWVWFY